MMRNIFGGKFEGETEAASRGRPTGLGLFAQWKVNEPDLLLDVPRPLRVLDLFIGRPFDNTVLLL